MIGFCDIRVSQIGKQAVVLSKSLFCEELTTTKNGRISGLLDLGRKLACV